MSAALPVVVTCGDPAGVGPELCLNLLARRNGPPLVVVGDREVLSARARMVGAPFNADDFESRPGARRAVWHCPVAVPPQVGKPSPRNAAHVLQQLQRAAEGCRAGRFRAMVTAPVAKSVVRQAGIPFVGITEHLAEMAGAPRAVMLMHSPKLRVALATTHLPVAAVPRAITRESLLATIVVLNSELRKRFTHGRPPRVLVAGLNPHAGEDGRCGREEIDVIIPAVAAARKRGVAVAGPFAADALLARKSFAPDECALAMFHDQALPAFKRADFDRGVNVTLGLPFVRVAPDHGVAADIAGKGVVRPGSMRAALALALKLAADSAAR